MPALNCVFGLGVLLLADEEYAEIVQRFRIIGAQIDRAPADIAQPGRPVLAARRAFPSCNSPPGRRVERKARLRHSCALSKTCWCR